MPSSPMRQASRNIASPLPIMGSLSWTPVAEHAHALHSNPFAFRTVWVAGEERNVISAIAASV